MIKTLLSTTCALIASVSLASDKIIVLNTASNNGNMFTQAQAYAKDLEQAGYNVEFVSPGDACKASAYLSKVPANQPVFSNIDAYGQAGPAAGLVEGCAPIYSNPETVVAAYLDHFHMCTVSQKDDPTAIFRDGSEFKIGTNKPSIFWQNHVDTLNAENNTSHQRIQYGGSGKTRAALLAGEVDYVFLTTKHAFTLESKGAVCFAEFTDKKTLKSDHMVKDLSKGDSPFSVDITTGWVMFNASSQQVDTMREQIQGFMHNMNSNIIAERGGKTPLNYYGWDTSYTERNNWINDSIKTWADAMSSK